MEKRYERASSIYERIAAILLVLLLLVATLAPMKAYANPERGDSEQGAVQLLSYRGYPDVDPDDWYVTSGMLDYAVDNGLLTGYDSGYFGPWDEITRGQVATVLFRIAGAPSESSKRFDDVNYSEYYGPAILWARSTGVINGYTGTNNFGPDASVTREEFAAMLANYADVIGGVDIASNGNALNAISGAEDVSSWARPALAWAVDEGILSGVVQSDGTSRIDSKGAAQRSMAAKMFTVLHRDVLGLGQPEDEPDEIPEFDPSAPSDTAYAEEVKDATNLRVFEATKNGDSYSVVVEVDGAESLSVGDVVAIGRSDDLPFGTVLAITQMEELPVRELDGEEIKQMQIQGRIASFNNAYSKMRINETLTQSDLASVANGTYSLSDEDGAQGEVSLSATDGGTRLSFTANIDDDMNLSGAILVSEFYADVNFDAIPKKDNFNINPFDDALYYVDIDAGAVITPSVSLTVNAISGDAAKIRLASIPVPFATIDTVGVGLYLDVYVVVGASGEISFSTSISTSVSAKKDYLQEDADLQGEIKSRNPGNLEAKISGNVGAMDVVSLHILDSPVINAGVEGGLKFKAGTTARPTMTCIDLGFWLYSDVFVDLTCGDGQLWQATQEIVDSQNSPFELTRHCEITDAGWKWLDDCTWSESAQTIDIANYIGADFFSSLDDFPNMSDVHATAGTEYSNGDIIISTYYHEVNSPHYDDTVNFVSIEDECGYSIYGIHPGMYVANAKNAANEAGGSLYQEVSLIHAYVLPNGQMLQFWHSEEDPSTVSSVSLFAAE